jgi:glycosyltransferase involved in cell wall biosynthesis
LDNRPLRILQILRAPVGGLFRHVLDLTEELARRGHEIGIVVDTLTADGLTGTRLEWLAGSATLGIHRFPMPRTIGLGDLTTPRAVRALARQLDIDVLHGHGAKGGLNSRLARTGTQVALNTPHGGVLNYKRGSAAGKLFRGVEGWLARRTDAYIFESEHAQRSFHDQIGHPPSHQAVIHNGLSEAEFSPVPLNDGARDFVFIGEFRDIKGIAYLAEALTDLRRSDGKPATIAMAGSGPEWERWTAWAESAEMAGRVDLLGVRPAREALAHGDVLVVPSLAESLPYVVLEGAAAGRPVIATRVGGMGEIFGPTSMSLIPAADSQALQRAMQAALHDPASAQREAEIRYDYVRPRFSIVHMTDEIEALYRKVLAARRARR